jgi:hypothetical protein
MIFFIFGYYKIETSKLNNMECISQKLIYNYEHPPNRYP